MTRIYTLQDVFQQLNQDSGVFIDTSPDEPVNQFLGGDELLKFQESASFVDWTSYPWEVADQDGPTGFWLMGDPTGSASAFDSNPYGPKRPAAATASPSFGQNMPSMPGLSACLFNGSTQYCDAGTGSFDPSANKAFTIEAWIKPATVDTTFRRIGGMEATVNHGAQLYWQSSVGWGFLRGDASAGNDTVTGGSPNTSNWSHVVGTYDGTTMTLYVNGVSVGTPATSSRAADVSGATLRIGGTQASLNGNATIAAFAVYPVALTATQVANHYAWGTAAPARAAAGSYATSGVEVTTLALNPSAGGYWRCNDPIGSIVANDIGGGNKDGAGGGSGYQFGEAGASSLIPWPPAPRGPLVADTNRAISFDARFPGRIVIPSIGANLNTGAMTFMAWVYLLPDPRPLILTGSYEQIATRLAPGFAPTTRLYNILGTFPNVGLTAGDNGTNFFATGWLNGNGDNNGGAQAFAYGTWTHVAVVYTGVASPNRTVYINGVAGTTITSSSTADFTGAMRLGEDERWTGYDTTVEGAITEAVIFGYALSTGQVQSIYNAGVTAQTSARYGLDRYPNPPQRGSNRWGSAIWNDGGFLWG